MVRLTDKELRDIVASHSRWLETGGKDGERADFSNVVLAYEDSLAGLDLRNANFSEADLSYADLTETNLAGADLSSAALTRVDMSDAKLGGAKLNSAIASWAVLKGTDLANADLSDTDLTGVKFNGAAIDGANFTDAVLTAADMRGVKFRAAPDFRDATCCEICAYEDDIKRFRNIPDASGLFIVCDPDDEEDDEGAGSDSCADGQGTGGEAKPAGIAATERHGKLAITGETINGDLKEYLRENGYRPLADCERIRAFDKPAMQRLAATRPSLLKLQGREPIAVRAWCRALQYVWQYLDEVSPEIIERHINRVGRIFGTNARRPIIASARGSLNNPMRIRDGAFAEGACSAPRIWEIMTGLIRECRMEGMDVTEFAVAFHKTGNPFWTPR